MKTKPKQLSKEAWKRISAALQAPTGMEGSYERAKKAAKKLRKRGTK